ncbi:methyl-CpG-binding domain protein 6 [Ambystoma mexicanum]|uniref:methyl-CpG-binding domain protein 6 n=1 Tax=Ambystoma mexicanum TaxID=8296 RepID=UPI0037E9BDBD
MNGATESGGGDTEAGCTAIQVPVGWQRQEVQDTVVYISPSGTTLTSLEQIRNYLLTDGTCKCGLECPINIHKVFNFDPTVAVKQRSAEDVRAGEDMTKLCNHRRKIVAMATLYKSIEDSPHTLQNQPGGCGLSQMYHTGGPMNRLQHPASYGKPSSFDNDIFTRMMMEKANSLSRPQCAEQKDEPYPSCSGERYDNFRPGQRVAYQRHHGATFGEAYSVRNPSSLPLNRGYDSFSRSDSSFPPEYYPNTFPHHRNFSQSSDINPSYSFPNQDVWEPAPKSLSVSSCNYGPGHAFSTSFQKPLEEQPHDLQNPMVCPEKDPLGILNSISNKPAMQRYHCMNAPSPLHAQVPLSNLNTPPESTSVSSCRSSPLIRAGHDSQKSSSLSRTNTLGSPSTTLSSISSPGGSIEPSPQRSRHSSASSEHGAFLLGAHYSSNTGKPVPRSPMPAGSPKLSVPQSPKAILEGLLHQGKVDPGSLVSVNNALIHQSNNLPTVSSGAMHEKKNQPGFLGLPLGHLLNQQNTSSFPASSLLSAAAKAQLASQKKMDGGGSLSDGPCTLQNRLLNSNVLLSMVNPQGGVALVDRPSAPQKDHTKRRRQRRSPTVLHLIKESNLNHTGIEEGPSKRTHGKSGQRSQVQLPVAKNSPRLPNIAAVTGVPRPPDVSPIRPEEEMSKMKGNTHSMATNQPLSSLLTLLSAQSIGNTNSHATNVSFTQPHSNGGVGASPTHLNSSTVPNLPFIPMPLGSTAEGAACQSTNSNPWPVFQDFNTQLLNLFGQLSSVSSEQPSGSQSQLKFHAPSSFTTSSSSGSTIQGGATVSNASTNLATGTKVTSSPSPTVSCTAENSVLPCHLPPGDVFPFLNQEEVLPLSNSVANAPSFSNLLTQSFLASLPLSLALSQRQHLLNQSLMNLISTSLVGQNDVPLGLQNTAAAASPALQASLGELEAQTLQSLLMASLLQNPSQTSLVPPLDFLQQQSQLLSALMSLPPVQDTLPTSPSDPGDRGDGPVTGNVDDAFSAFPAADVLQSLLFPALSLPPALLALNSALLAASLSSSDSSVCQTQVSTLGSTSTINTPTTTVSSSTEGKASISPAETPVPIHHNVAAPGRFNPLIPPLINPLLSASLLGDLSALNTSASGTPSGSLQALLGTNPLLQNQQPLLPSLQSPLGLQLFQGQSLLLGHLHSSNPLTCLLQNLQLNSSPGLEKQGHSSQQSEGTSTSSSPSPSVSQQSSEQNSSGKSNHPAPAVSPFCMDTARKVQDLMSCIAHPSPSIVGNASSALDYSHTSKPLDYSLSSHENLRYGVDRTAGPTHLPDRGCPNIGEKLVPESQSSEMVRPPFKKSRRSIELGEVTEGFNGEMSDHTPVAESREHTHITKSSESELPPQKALKHPNHGGNSRADHVRDWDAGKHFNGQVTGQCDRATLCPRIEDLSQTLPRAFWRCNREVQFLNSGSSSPDCKGSTADPFLPIESKTDLAIEVPSLSFLMEQPEGNTIQREATVTEVPPEKLKPSRRGRRKNANTQRMSTRLDGPPSKWGNADPGSVSNTDRRSNTRQQGPGRPAKSCRRRII